MYYFKFICICIVFITEICLIKSLIVKECSILDALQLKDLKSIIKAIIPEINGKGKGEAGKIGIIGGSMEYTGAPYFSAISALKVGADLAYVITTESAAPIIKSYSPDLIVYPFLNSNSASKLNFIISKMDVIVIGPGLGREDDTMMLTHEIIQTCKSLNKPLVIDADGLYALSKNISIIKDYPSPGVILTPNNKEAMRLMQAVPTKNMEWYEYWGNNVSVLAKGERDEYLSSIESFRWSSSEGGSGRRAGGQGDILSGSLATFFNWALKAVLCENEMSVQLAQSVSSHAAAILTRASNAKAFEDNGRGMLASDMLDEINKAFEESFSN